MTDRDPTKGGGMPPVQPEQPGTLYGVPVTVSEPAIEAGAAPSPAKTAYREQVAFYTQEVNRRSTRMDAALLAVLREGSDVLADYQLNPDDRSIVVAAAQIVSETRRPEGGVRKIFDKVTRKAIHSFHGREGDTVPPEDAKETIKLPSDRTVATVLDAYAEVGTESTALMIVAARKREERPPAQGVVAQAAKAGANAVGRLAGDSVIAEFGGRDRAAFIAASNRIIARRYGSSQCRNDASGAPLLWHRSAVLSTRLGDKEPGVRLAAARGLRQSMRAHESKTDRSAVDQPMTDSEPVGLPTAVKNLEQAIGGAIRATSGDEKEIRKLAQQLGVTPEQARVTFRQLRKGQEQAAIIQAVEDHVVGIAEAKEKAATQKVLAEQARRAEALRKEYIRQNNAEASVQYNTALLTPPEVLAARAATYLQRSDGANLIPSLAPLFELSLTGDRTAVAHIQELWPRSIRVVVDELYDNFGPIAVGDIRPEEALLIHYLDPSTIHDRTTRDRVVQLRTALLRAALRETNSKEQGRDNQQAIQAIYVRDLLDQGRAQALTASGGANPTDRNRMNAIRAARQKRFDMDATFASNALRQSLGLDSLSNRLRRARSNEAQQVGNVLGRVAEAIGKAISDAFPPLPGETRKKWR